jgi:hypothetical protein
MRGLWWFTRNRQVPWLLHKAKTEGLAGGDRIWLRREASKRATRDMIEVLALGGCEGLNILMHDHLMENFMC